MTPFDEKIKLHQQCSKVLIDVIIDGEEYDFEVNPQYSIGDIAERYKNNGYYEGDVVIKVFGEERGRDVTISKLLSQNKSVKIQLTSHKNENKQTQPQKQQQQPKQTKPNEELMVEPPQIQDKISYQELDNIFTKIAQDTNSQQENKFYKLIKSKLDQIKQQQPIVPQNAKQNSYQDENVIIQFLNVNRGINQEKDEFFRKHFDGRRTFYNSLVQIYSTLIAQVVNKDFVKELKKRLTSSENISQTNSTFGKDQKEILDSIKQLIQTSKKDKRTICDLKAEIAKNNQRVESQSILNCLKISTIYLNQQNNEKLQKIMEAMKEKVIGFETVLSLREIKFEHIISILKVCRSLSLPKLCIFSTKNKGNTFAIYSSAGIVQKKQGKQQKGFLFDFSSVKFLFSKDKNNEAIFGFNDKFITMGNCLSIFGWNNKIVVANKMNSTIFSDGDCNINEILKQREELEAIEIFTVKVKQ